MPSTKFDPNKNISELASSGSSPPPIFIGGAGRSGTTLLRSIVNAHPRIAVGPELKITPYIAKLREDIAGFIPHLERNYFLEERDIDSFFGNLISSLLSKYHQQTGKARIGEKTPNNTAYFRQLHQIFPESPLLHIIRDGRDVVRSLLQQNWLNGRKKRMKICSDPTAAARYWRQMVQEGRDAFNSSETLSSRYLEIRYEDLVTRPERTARKVFAHIGEDWDPDVLKFYQTEGPEYDHDVYRPISDSSVGKWRHELSNDIKRQIKPIIGPLLIDLDYATDMDW